MCCLKAGKFVNILNVCPDLYERTIVLNGVSKAYSMTGWRIGYAGGPENLIQAMTIIQSQSTSNPTSISQYAAVVALDGDQSFIQTMVDAFEQRHAFVLNAFNAMDGVECLPADGTFYSFPNVEGMIKRLGAGKRYCTGKLPARQNRGGGSARFGVWFGRAYPYFLCDQHGESGECVGTDCLSLIDTQSVQQIVRLFVLNVTSSIFLGLCHGASTSSFSD